MELIVCVDANFGISKNGVIPWKNNDDAYYFKNTTSNPIGHNLLIVGYNTYNSMSKKVLETRNIAVVTSKPVKVDDSKVFNLSFHESLIHALIFAKSRYYTKIFIAGGVNISKEALENNIIHTIHFTQLFSNYDCDNSIEFIQYFLKNSYEIKKTIPINDGEIYIYRVSHKSEETQYLDLMKNILYKGVSKCDRTGTGTLSIFGNRMEFDVSNVIPILTTKKVFFRGVVEELLWFLKGDTNVNHLIEKNVHIWDGNSTKEFMDSIGISREERDIGPCYGWQWRHFGAEYNTMHDNYNNKGVDQFKNIIDTIKLNPLSRRMIMSAWNPIDLDKMNLPPCHVLYQFYVENNKLSCQMYQRSADVFLGLPFNIASTACLMKIISNITSTKMNKLSICIGDAHIYNNHVSQCLTQLSRKPFEFPTLEIDNLKTFEDVFNLTFDDFKLENYQSHPPIKAKMAI